MVKVDWFRLSGTDVHGDEAARLFEIAREHGFDRISGDFAPWPCRTDAKPRFIASVDVSGVAAAAQVSFDTPEALLDFLTYAPLVEPAEPAAIKCYRKLAGYATPNTTEGE